MAGLEFKLVNRTDTDRTFLDYTLSNVTLTSQQLDGGAVWQVQYSYDYVQGERTVTYPSGAVRTYQLDDLNRLDTVEMGDGTVIADYAYDVVNRFNTLGYANGLTNRTDYDGAGRITRVSSAVADYRYGYDQVGNRTWMQRSHRRTPDYVDSVGGINGSAGIGKGVDQATVTGGHRFSVAAVGKVNTNGVP